MFKQQLQHTEKKKYLFLSLSLPLLLKEKFSLFQKFWDSLDYREKVKKSDTMAVLHLFVITKKFLVRIMSF